MRKVDYNKKRKKKLKKIINISTIILILSLIITFFYSVKAIKNRNNISKVDNSIEKETTEKLQLIEDIIYEMPIEEFEEVEKIQNGKNTIDSNSYYIKVNKEANVVTIYTKDSNGDYTLPVRAMLCSTGTFTPSCGKYPNSTYKTSGSRRRWNYLQGNVYGQYATHITGNILFHSVPYLSQSEDSLEYWEYDKLGTSASLGCVRLAVADAKWIYDNIPGGTAVEFYSDSNPGPLGKPAARKISDNEKCRNWDPTDPTEGNPWKGELETRQENKSTQSSQRPKTSSSSQNTTTTSNEITNTVEYENTIEVSNEIDTEENNETTVTNETTNEFNNDTENTTGEENP